MINRILLAVFIIITWSSARAASPVNTGNGAPAIPLLRLKLVLDAFNNDDIAIGFLATATTPYNNQLDSRYFPGIDAPEGLASFSSDNVKLSVNIVPLPKQNPLVIRLDVEAANSGPFTLERTELDSISQSYDIWLMDKFTKDSVNLRTNTNYAFDINKNDTTTFGGNRFAVIIRQNPLLSLRLLAFDAFSSAGQANISWTTENEQDNTGFAVERSIDQGATFFTLDSLTSNSAGYYTFTDKTPVDGTDMYRLRMQDMNGVTSYSNVVSLDFGSSTPATAITKSNNISIYPNPSSGMINLAIAPEASDTLTPGTTKLQTDSFQSLAAAIPASTTASYAIKIINIKGVVIKSATSSSASWQDNLSALTPGTYIVQVINNSTKTVVGKSTFIKL